MIELGRPAVALVGALIALLPIALHFLSRRAPNSAPLPTARFLTPERLTRVRFQRRPTDLAHLAVRVLFVLAAFTAFAEPRFASRVGGTVDVVLLDGSLAMRPFWSSAIDSVRAIVASAGDVLPGSANSPATSEDLSAAQPRAMIVVLGATARTISATDVALDSLVAAPPEDASVPSLDLSTALQALRATAASLRADSARAWLVFVARRDGWNPGLGEVRREAWSGDLGLVAFRPPESADDSLARPWSVPNPPLPAQAFVLVSSEDEAALVGTALEALGLQLLDASSEARSGTVVALSGSSAEVNGASRALELGATVLLGPSTHDVLPGVDPIWVPAEPGAMGPHPLIRFRDGLILIGVRTRPGRAAPGARWLAATEDGAAAAVASPVGPGCLVTAAFEPMSVVEQAPASLPDVLWRMLRGCEVDGPRPDGALPLDGGGLAILRGVVQDGSAESGLPSGVALEPLRDRAADPLLVRGLLLLALTAALAEAYLSSVHPRARIETAAAER